MTTYTPERRAAMIAALTEKLKNLALAATPGPWACGTFPRLLIVQIEDGVPLKHTPIADIGAGSIPWDATSNSKQEYEDAAYIAAASPDAVIALIEEIERLRAAPSTGINGLTEAETDESMSVRGLSQKAAPSTSLSQYGSAELQGLILSKLAAPSTSPLTVDAMWDLWDQQGVDDMAQPEAIAFGRAVEAAHGINGRGAAPSNLVNGLTDAETDESMSVRGLSQKAAPSYELPFIPWSKEAEMMEAWAAPSTSQKCEWTFSDDDSGTWASSCGELWSFIDGGPKENRVSYCHHCGHPVKIKGGA